MTDWSRGHGGMAELIREHDWAATSLGPIADWPDRLKAIVEMMLAVPLVSSVALTTDRLLLYNDAAAHLYGTRHPAALGRPLRQTFADSYPAVASLYDRVFAGESVEVHGQPLAVGTGKGDEVFDAYLTPVRTADGSIIGAHMVGLEIGSRMRAETALRKSEQRLQRVLETDAVAVLFFSRDGVLTNANDVFLRMTGYSREEVESGRLTWQQMTPAEWLDVSQEQMDQFFATGRIGPYEKEYLRKDGSRAWMQFAGRDLGDGVIVEIGVDVSDRKRIEASLRETKDRYAANLIRMQQLYELQARIATETDLKAALDEIVAAACEFLNTERGCIQLVSADGERLEMFSKHGYGPDSRFIEHFMYEGSKPACDAARRDKARLIIEDVNNFPPLAGTKDRDVALAEGIRATQSTPIISRDGELHGVLSNQFYAPHRPTEEQFKLLDLLVWTASDFVTRHKVQKALRESEERQAFLLKLSDALRPLSDSGMIVAQATRILGEHLQADRTFIAEIEPDGVNLQVHEEHLRSGAPSVLGKHNFDQFGTFVSRELVKGNILAVGDILDISLTAAERAHYATIGIAAYLLVPLVRNGRLAACLAINHRTAHPWSEADKGIARQTADRTWAAVERARAEAALRISEKKYRTLFESIDEGFYFAEAIFDADGRCTDILYNDENPAAVRMTGQSFKGRLLSAMGDYETYWREIFGRVAKTGVAERLERYAEPDGIWYDFFVFKPLEAAVTGLAVVFRDVTERKRAEEAMRASGDRQAYLLKLSDALRPRVDPVEMQKEAMRVLGEQLGLSRAQYYEAEPDGEHVVGSGAYADGLPPVFERVRMDDFGVFVKEGFRAGRTVVVADASRDPRVSKAQLQSYIAFGFNAFAAVPLIKEGRFVACLGVHQAAARAWTDHEISLLEETAERLWAAVERARAEAALRESEERFAQFANASASALWIRDAATLAMEYASPAMRGIYGIEPDALLGPIERWASLITPDDRDIALKHLETARNGEAVVHEFRIQRPSDRAFRWIRDTDFSLKVNGQVHRIGGIAEDITEAKLAIEHQGVLLAELQHRVRNTMAIIKSITARTGERAETVAEYTDLMGGRLRALARVQTLLTRSANVRVDIANIVQDEVSAQAQHEGQYELEGPATSLSPKAAEVLTLAVHELATNALKYGALSVPDGRVSVRWATTEKRGTPWLSLKWAEEGAPERPQPTPEAPRRRGFGSELIEGRIPYELGGGGAIKIESGGAQCHLEFPLTDGASVLETGAPQRATVFGGALDMTGEPDLSGYRVLVVEDDYYLATDAARALQGAGAQVLGPCPTELSARAELSERRPDAAVVDINLGSGLSFKLAETLKDQGIPFVFTTGYDREVVPEEFSDVEHLMKPIQLRHIVKAISKLLAPNM